MRGAPPRSWLFVPGDRPERFAKAIASGADAVILDLEDAVAPAARESAIVQVDAFLAAVDDPGAATIWVRVDDASRRHPAIAALARHRSLDGYVIPKFEDPAQCAGWQRPVLALIETPKAVVDVARITAAAAGDLLGIALGPEDLASALGVDPGTESLGPAASQVVMAAAAAGVSPYACPGSIGEFRDAAAWRSTLDAGRRIGSHGALCIHPSQVDAANRAFSPSATEVDRARRICERWDAEAGDGSGVGAISVDGRMVDRPVLERARRLLARDRG